MPVLQEGRYAGEFVVSEGNGKISRETITVLSGQTLEAGAVLGKVTASGKYKALDPAAVDGSEVAAGILYDAVDASAADAEGVAIVRLAEVNAAELVWPAGITGARADHRARRARRAHHHRPLTPGSFSEDNADARSGHLLQLRLLHGGADRCHQQDALRARAGSASSACSASRASPPPR